MFFFFFFKGVPSFCSQHSFCLGVFVRRYKFQSKFWLVLGFVLSF